MKGPWGRCRIFPAYSPKLFRPTLNVVMSDKIRQIIRSQWALRHSRSPLVREEARNLIRVHVELLRGQPGKRVQSRARVGAAA